MTKSQRGGAPAGKRDVLSPDSGAGRGGKILAAGLHLAGGGRPPGGGVAAPHEGGWRQAG